jgi:hypothetical protein
MINERAKTYLRRHPLDQAKIVVLQSREQSRNSYTVHVYRERCIFLLCRQAKRLWSSYTNNTANRATLLRVGF